MTLRRSLGALGVCLGLGGTLAAADPVPATPDSTVEMLPFLTGQQPATTAPQPTTPPRPGAALPPAPAPAQRLPAALTPQVQVEPAPVTDVFARTPQAGTTASRNFVAPMIGDQGVRGYARQNVVVPPFPVLVPGTGNPQRPGLPVAPRVVFVGPLALPLAQTPIVTGGSFKIAENESPRPLDRFFVTYNYFDDVALPTAFINRNFDVHRQTFGMEKTFLDGDASLGVRMNLIQTDGAINDDDFGDTTFIAKYALRNDPCTGNVLSGGLAVTAPTGPRTVLYNGQIIRSTLLQPWTGFIYNLNENWYTHGFSSLIIPTDNDDVLLATADVGVAWRMYQASCCSDNFISSITPTIEGHYTAALNQQGLDEFRPVSFPEGVFVLTTGAHVGLGCCATLTTALAIPLTGPTPFDYEAIVQLNIRF